jgi:GAF domain-containing protein
MNQPLTEALADFARAMATPYDPDELLHQLVQRTATILHADGAGIMLADDAGRLHFVAATDDRIVAAERLQDRVQLGACFDAYSRGEPVAASDLREHRERWPAYADGILHMGLHAVLGVPLRGAGRTIGVLNVYRAPAGPWGDEELAAAEVLATMATGYILNANHRRDHATTVEQLRTAIASRDVIGQAKGILMARLDLDADAAFEVLRDRSQRTNRKLREVAAELVSEQLRDA